MAYTGDPQNSPVDAVRFLLSDTSTPELLSDTEIEWLLDQHGNAYSAAAAGARTLGGRNAGVADSKSVGPLSISKSNTGKRWFDLANLLEAKARAGLAGTALAPYSGGISRSDKELIEEDTDRDAPWFKRGLMDHPEAAHPLPISPRHG
jgi:hypothetical protein